MCVYRYMIHMYIIYRCILYMCVDCLFLAALGLCCFAQAFSSCSQWGLLLTVAHGLPLVVTFLVVEYNLLQCSCLENPRDGGAWWAAVSGVAQSRTRLKRLSSSSSSRIHGLSDRFYKVDRAWDLTSDWLKSRSVSRSVVSRSL